MKQWLNNWEKIIGERLGRAQTKPESYVWDLIEQDLDAQQPDKVIATWRIAGLAALLLLGTSAAYLLNAPNGDLATTSTIPSLIESDQTDWSLFDAKHTDNQPSNFSESTITTLVGNVTETVASNNIQEIDVRSEDVSSASLDLLDVMDIAQIAKERTDESLIVAADELKAPSQLTEAIAQIEVERKRQHIDMFALPLERAVNIDNQPESHPLNQLEPTNKLQAIMLQSQLTLNRFAPAIDLKNEILVSPSNVSLKAMQSMALLKSAVGVQSTSMDLGNTDLVISEGIMTLKPFESNNELMNAEMAMATDKADWIVESLNELETWKASLEEQNKMNEGDKDAQVKSLEELIDEAKLDEEDPLTKRQNEAKDLYRASNINKGFHIGMISGFTSTWVTKATRNPEVNRSYVQHKFNPGYQIGLNMGYDFTEHFGLMTEFKYSNEGGRYYNPLRQRDQHLDLRYIEIPLYAKVKHSKMTEKMRPIVFNYLLGFTYSDLRNINVSDGGIDKRFGQDYNTSEWGLTAGFDFDYYFNKNFFWSVGMRAGISGNAKSFPKLKGEDGNGTMSLDAGLFTRLSFRLPGK